jgi:hypothetical protein
MADEGCIPRRAPIACSLGTAELRDRQLELRDLAARALIRCERTAGGAVLLFRETSGEVEFAVRDLARRESECCPFFDFVIESTAETVRLEVDAPEEARSFVDALVAAVRLQG